MMIEGVASIEVPEFSDPILDISDEDWWRAKAAFCQTLYNRGSEEEPWSDERAKFWHQSLLYFVEHFIQPDLPTPDFHKDWYWWRVREQNYMNVAPRDHAKTSVHAVFSTVWEIAMNRNLRFFIVFSTTDVAKLVLSEIKSHLTQNPRIRAGFGVFNPAELPPDQRTVEQDWSQNSITVNRDKPGIKDPTVAVAGSLTNVLSRRADRLMVDDLLTDKIAFSEAESERLVRWFGNDVQPVLVSDGQEIITGTLYHRGDFYHHIKSLDVEQGGMYRVFIGDAIVNEETEEVLWSDRWSWELLEKQRRKLGSVVFNRNYRNRIMSDEDSPFPMIWFKGGTDQNTQVEYKGCYDNSFALGTPPITARQNWLNFVTMGIDPAIGTSDKAKFFVAVVLGLDRFNQVILADAVRGHAWNFVYQKRVVIQLYETWSPRYVVVESNAYQKALGDGLKEDYPMMPVVPYYTSGQREPPELGIPAMDIYFEMGRVRLPRQGQKSLEMTDKLVEELHFWTKYDTSDFAMAFWFAFMRLLPELQRRGVIPSPRSLIFGDRLAWEAQRVRGLSGHVLPRRTLQQLNTMASSAPLAHLSPLKSVREGKHPIPGVGGIKR